MGTWGTGNLDSDYALDELSERTSELLTPMLLRWQRADSREYDEYDHTTLFVELELAFALADKGLLASGRTIPAPAAVRALATAWFVDYDAYMADNPWPERRTVIAASFERFATICAQLEGTGELPSPPPRPRPRAAQATAPVTAMTKKTTKKTKTMTKKTKTKS